MKTLIFTLWLALIAVPASANDLCYELNDDNLIELSEKMLTRAAWFTDQEVAQTIKYLNEATYIFKKEVTDFAVVRDHFLDRHNEELYVMKYESKSTGIVYTYVFSYPGDNEYGAFFIGDDTEIIATISDGDIVVDELYCTNQRP